MIRSREMATRMSWKTLAALLVRGAEIPQGWGAVPHHGDKPQQTHGGITIRTTGGCKEESQSLFDTKFY